MRAYVTAPATGDYTFWIASDDNGELLISTDTLSSNATQVASVPGWTNSRQWDKFAEQQSTTISLVAGEMYYLEALMKEGSGGDNLAIAWSGPTIAGPTVIDAQYLTVFGTQMVPVAKDDAATTSQGAAVTVPVLANDGDPNDDVLSVGSFTAAADGTVTDNGDGTLTYTPNANFSGSDSFTYTAEDGNGGDATATVTINVSAAETLRFAMIGDFGTNNTAEADVAAMVALQSPEIIVTAGDNRYGNLTYQQAVGDHYGQYVSTTSGGTSPVNRFFAAPGNHDYSDGGGINEYLAYFDLPGSGVTSTNTSGSERYYDVIDGPVHFFFVDSDEAISSSTDRAAQQSWLQTQMSASTTPWQVVVLHHAPYSSAQHGNNATMQWNYAAWGADVVFAGHDHTYERILQSGIPYFVNGLGGRGPYNFGTPINGSQFRYNADYGAMIIDATSTTMSFQFLNRSGIVIDTYSIPAPPNVVDAQVSQSSDDAEEKLTDGSMYLDSSDIELGNDPAFNGDQVEGLRFQNLNIPQAAMITSAYLTFDADADETEATSLTIRAENTDNAGTFTAAAFDITGRPMTTASVSWTPGDWINAFEYQSPDLSALVQEVVNRAGWVPGNSLSFIIDGSGRRTAESYDGDAANAAQLHIEFEFSANAAPDALNDFASTTRDVDVVVSPLVNDSDPDGDTPVIESFEQPSDGIVTDNGDGTLTYSPNSGFVGLDQFTYTITDGNGARDTATLYLRVSPSFGQSVMSQIDQSSDDAEERIGSGAVDLTSSDIEIGDDPGHNGDQIAGLRFNGLAIPQGAKIASAYFEFETDELDAGTTDVLIRAQAADDVSTFTSAVNDISSRPTTTASVPWSPPAWNTVNEKQRSPDLASLIQEVVDRGGWTSGNSLALVIAGTGSRTAESYDGESANAPRLHIEFTNLDYGDAPDSFPTLLDDSGAVHQAVGPRLGATRDSDLDGQPSINADGDGSDEDGVMFGFLGAGMTMAAVNIDLQAAPEALIDAWLDFDGDGIWQSDEKILDKVLATDMPSFETFNFDVNGDVVAGDSYARVRVRGSGVLSQTGYAADGEVEDYLVTIAPAATVVGRAISYGGTAPETAYGAGAIDTSKSALRSGQASSANYTNYTAGLNRVVIDIENRPNFAVTADDFVFRVGNTNTPSEWEELSDESEIPLPQITPSSGTDRITLAWHDGAIKNMWLQVTVKATNNTGLASEDVFYFGNQVGDVFGEPVLGTNAIVNATDVILTRFNQSLNPNDADIENEFDISKDGLVNAVDVILSRFNQALSGGLLMINVP